jgi:hypothetical protein
LWRKLKLLISHDQYFLAQTTERKNIRFSNKVGNSSIYGAVLMAAAAAVVVVVMVMVVVVVVVMVVVEKMLESPFIQEG